jgi:hypothetical protein
MSLSLGKVQLKMTLKHLLSYAKLIISRAWAQIKFSFPRVTCSPKKKWKLRKHIQLKKIAQRVIATM